MAGLPADVLTFGDGLVAGKQVVVFRGAGRLVGGKGRTVPYRGGLHSGVLLCPGERLRQEPYSKEFGRASKGQPKRDGKTNSHREAQRTQRTQRKTKT